MMTPLRVWLVLIALTGASFLVAEELNERTIAIAAIFVVAALKAELVIDHYMEARRAERHWIVLYLGWVAGVTLLLVWGHAW
jgi:hypothetical protein